MLFLIDDIDVVDGFGIRLQLAQPIDGLGGRQRVQDRDVLRRHEAAGRVFPVGQQLLDILSFVLFHLLQQQLRPLARQVRQQVGHLIGRHRFQDVRCALDIEPLEDGGLRLRLVDLFQSIGGLLVVQGRENGVSVLGTQLIDDIGDVGGM